MSKFIPSDDELVMFHYGEDLGPERTAAIGLAIADDAATAARYAALRRLLGASTLALTPAAPAPDFEQRLWRELRPQLDLQALSMRPARRPLWAQWLLPSFALAASLAVGVVIGTQWPSTPPVTAAAPVALSNDAGSRVLAAHLSQHLGQTERLLRVAENGGGADSEALAAALIDSNRLYAAAAERAGKPALAQFLTELEPVLRELANSSGDTNLGGAGLAQEQIRSRDLLYRLRALEALQTHSTQRL